MDSVVDIKPPDEEEEEELNSDKDVCKLTAGVTISSEIPPTENGCTETNLKCSCACGREIQLLKSEISELRNWKTERQLLDTDLADWKHQIDKWLRSKFGFCVTLKCESSSTPIRQEEEDHCSPENEIDNIPLNENPEDAVLATVDKEIIDSLNAGETEDVEITPDLFGHFLLNNDNYGGDSNESGDEGESIDEEEDLEELEPESSRTLRKRRRRNDSDSDTDCYTLSSSSTDDFTSTDDEEFLPQKKRGKGGPVHAPPYKKGSPVNLAKSKVPVKLSDTDNKEELMQLCRKGKGDIWECISCGFMLTSLENMLLHIKYNHSSSTHTCPYCRVVVLCRTPKDAILHQTQCKMKYLSTGGSSKTSNNNNNRVGVVPVVGPSRPGRLKEAVSTSGKVPSIVDVNTRLNKFVAELLEPSSSKKPFNANKTEPPAVVTLSSDDED